MMFWTNFWLAMISFFILGGISAVLEVLKEIRDQTNSKDV